MSKLLLFSNLNLKCVVFFIPSLSIFMAFRFAIVYITCKIRIVTHNAIIVFYPLFSFLFIIIVHQMEFHVLNIHIILTFAIFNLFLFWSKGCCGCCSALRPRYKRLVDNIFPVNPDDGLVKSNMEKLTFYSLSSPEKLDRIGEYLYQKAAKDIHRKRYKWVWFRFWGDIFFLTIPMQECLFRRHL